jgi:CRP-like cAMP-binding protein
MPGFGGYRDRDLAPLAAELEDRRVPAGTVLVEERSPGGDVFLVVEGRAVVVIGGREAGRVLPGEFVGEMAAVDHEGHSATVRAITPMRVFVLSANRFASLLQEAAVTRSLARTLSERLRRAVGVIGQGRATPEPDAAPGEQGY